MLKVATSYLLLFSSASLNGRYKQILALTFRWIKVSMTWEKRTCFISGTVHVSNEVYFTFLGRQMDHWRNISKQWSARFLSLTINEKWENIESICMLISSRGQEVAFRFWQKTLELANNKLRTSIKIIVLVTLGHDIIAWTVLETNKVLIDILSSENITVSDDPNRSPMYKVKLFWFNAT